MSGIDVAGLVLRALPVLISAIDAYKDAFRRSKVIWNGPQARAQIARLARAVLLQRRHLSEMVKSLLLQSGYRDVLDLDSDPLGCLDNQDVPDHLTDYLGMENDMAFTQILMRSEAVTRTIARSIAGLDPTDDLLAIIKANEVAKGWLSEAAPRMKLSLRGKDLEATIRELNETTNSLSSFASLMCQNQEIVGGSRATRKAARLSKALRQVRASATDLYVAMFQSWKPDCHSHHEAKMFLDDRVEAAASILRHTSGGNSKPSLAFRFILVAGSTSGQVSWHETSIEVLKNDGDNSHSSVQVTTKSPAPSRVTVISPAIASPTTPELTLVDDICAAIRLMESSSQPTGLVLAGERQMGTMVADDRTVYLHEKANLTTLGAILHGDKPMRCGAFVPPKLRMLLALRLASSLLQLSQTQWLGRPWSKEGIYFLVRQPSSTDGGLSGGRPGVDFTQPFVSVTFDNNNCPQPLATDNPTTKVALLELGILLLELWHETALEENFELERTPAGYYERLQWALKWLHDESDPPPDLYHKAVSHCVTGMLCGGESPGQLGLRPLLGQRLRAYYRASVSELWDMADRYFASLMPK